MVTIPPTIRIGTPLTLEAQMPEGTKEFKSRLEDIEDGMLLVGTPSEKGQFVPIAVNEYVTLQLSTASSAQVFIEGEIISRRNAPFPVLCIRPISFESKQQRDFHRVQARIDPQAVWHWKGAPAAQPQDAAAAVGTSPAAVAANAEAATAEDGGEWWQAVDAAIVDLSGGGLGLLADSSVPSGAHLRISFPLPMNEGRLEVDGNVMISRMRPGRDRRERTRYQLGVRFENLTRPDQERLVRAIHRFQIEQRRRAQGHDR